MRLCFFKLDDDEWDCLEDERFFILKLVESDFLVTIFGREGGKERILATGGASGRGSIALFSWAGGASLAGCEERVGSSCWEFQTFYLTIG